MPKSRIYVSLLSVLVLASAAVAFDLALRGVQRVPDEPLRYVIRGNPDDGRQRIIDYGCGACHTIPGIRRATGRVGPQLADLRNQIYIAGVLANSPDKLVEWIQDPREVDPLTAMPDLGVTEAEARDMAAFLYK